MEKNQKSAENVINSQSSSSRVMWKVCKDDEEVFDSVVNYKLLMPFNPTSSKFEKKLPRLSKPMVFADETVDAATKSLTRLALCYKASHETLDDMAIKRRARVLGYWQRLFDLLRIQASPSLTLRYKSSYESLKIQRSIDALQERAPSRCANPANANPVTTGVKLETCFFPSYQTAVVREVAPTFAHRMFTPDNSDPRCSQSRMLRTPPLKSSKVSTVLNAKADKASTPESTITNGQIAVADDNAKFKSIKKSAGSSIGGAGVTALKENCNRSAPIGSPNFTLQTLQQRQHELHQYRVLIEKRRLELLDLKIVREREDAFRHKILFHKDLKLKHNQIKSYEDNNSSQA